MKPRLLDLFCGAGGAAMGYHLAGFAVEGVDVKRQPHFPFTFHQGDALTYPLDGFDVIHASPPCQRYSATKTMHTSRWREYPEILPQLRSLFHESKKIYIIENVKGAPLINPFRLTGIMFDLKMHRERWFESNAFFFTPPPPGYCGHVVGKDGFVCMVGGGDSGRERIPADHRTKAAWQRASSITWMTKREMSQAIPPAYTEFIGSQLIRQYFSETTQETTRF